MMPLPITAVILTLNEESNLPDCLGALRGWCPRIVVVDSGSTDRTAEIAREAGAAVLVHPFQTHTAQWRWALEQLPADSEWVLGLDADQSVSPELAESIRAAFRSGEPAADGFYMARREIFQGRWIRHGGYYPKYLLKLFRRSKVVLDPQEKMEHHFYINGPAQTLRGDLVEANRKERDLSMWCEKHLRYARLAAEEEWLRRTTGRRWAVRPTPWGTPDQRTAFSKQLWDRLPLYTRSFLYFGWRYVLRLGFLDGPEGRRFHLLHGLWYRLLIDAYLDARLKAGPKTISPGGPPSA